MRGVRPVTMWKRNSDRLAVLSVGYRAVEFLEREKKKKK